jgi:hypothetical protein
MPINGYESFSVLIALRVAEPAFEHYLSNIVHCLTALEKVNAKDNDGNTITKEIIITDCGSPPHYLTKIQSIASKYNNCRVIHTPCDKWHKSKVFNVAIQASKGQRLFIVDCDTVVPPHYAQAHLENAAPNNFTVSRVLDAKKGTPATSDLEELYKYKPQMRDCGWSHISVPREWLVDNGFNEDYTGYAAEDDELNMRMQVTGLRQVEVHTKPVHLYHPTQDETYRRIGRWNEFARQQTNNRNRYYSWLKSLDEK